MFESLSDKLQNITRKLRGQARITEKDLKEMLREVKLALLEADVNYLVVKAFIKSVEEKALGEEVMKSLTPGQQVVKIVKDELTAMLGGTDSKLNMAMHGPTVIMLIGLQGSGKTTLAGKLANYLRKQGKKPLMVACDVYRPAAITQLKTLGKALDIPVYSEEDNKDVISITKNAFKEANSKMCDVILIDTAGRLQVDEVLMDELVRLKAFAKPHEVMLVVDGMVGQEAVNVASAFNEKIGIDSISLTKLDSDTRGGAALSVKHITGKPIKFASVGEKMNDLEMFHPERVASRILGMGDVLTVIEQAEELYAEEEAEDLEKKIRQNEFTLEDFRKQIKKIRKMGMNKLMSMLPGIPSELRNAEIDEKQIDKIEAIISSMTNKEKRDTSILNASRRKRIAAGSGTQVSDVNNLVAQYEQMRKMMKDLSNGKNPLSALGMKRKGFR